MTATSKIRLDAQKVRIRHRPFKSAYDLATPDNVFQYMAATQ